MHSYCHGYNLPGHKHILSSPPGYLVLQLKRLEEPIALILMDASLLRLELAFQLSCFGITLNFIFFFLFLCFALS